jgi:hypothetical protein
VRSGATAIPQSTFLQFLTDMLKVNGVMDIVNGTQFVVSAGAGLTVNIAAGRAYILASGGGDGYPIINSAQIANLALTANSSGNPRISSIVLYVDLAASPVSDGSGVAKVVSVDGTPAGSPTAPSGATIQAAIGASNPYIILANVTVNSGGSVPASIADVRPQAGWRADLLTQDAWVSVAATVAGTTTLNLSLGKKFKVTMGAGNTTLAFSNVPLIPKTVLIKIIQDSVGGRTVSWWTGLSWPGATVPTLTTTANKGDEFGFNFLTVTNDSTHTSEGFTVGLNI